MENGGKIEFRFSDGLFKFPVKTYDGYSLKKWMRKQEEEENEDEPPQEADWVVGYARIPVSEFIGVRDFFSPGKDMASVAKEGHDLTIVYTRTLGDFICTWRADKYLIELDRFVEGYEGKINKHATRMLIEKEKELVEEEEKWARQNPSRKWWQWGRKK